MRVSIAPPCTKFHWKKNTCNACQCGSKNRGIWKRCVRTCAADLRWCAVAAFVRCSKTCDTPSNIYRFRVRLAGRELWRMQETRRDRVVWKCLCLSVYASRSRSLCPLLLLIASYTASERATFTTRKRDWSPDTFSLCALRPPVASGSVFQPYFKKNIHKHKFIK